METGQVPTNLSISRAWKGIFSDSSVRNFLLSEKGLSKKPQHAVDKSSYMGTEPVTLNLAAGAATVWAGWLGPGKPSAVSSTNSVFSLIKRENYTGQACGFKRFIWARTEEKSMDVPHFHDIGLMTLSSYCLIRPFSAFLVINKLLPQWLTIHVLFFKFLFLWQIFTKSKSYQPFPVVFFIPTSLPSEHSTQCFEFQWIIRKGRMGSAIWKWSLKLTVLQKYASFFFSPWLILTQSSDIETDARLHSGENNASMNFASSNLLSLIIKESRSWSAWILWSEWNGLLRRAKWSLHRVLLLLF